MEKELSSLLSCWNTYEEGPYLCGNSIAENLLGKFVSFRAFKDIVQCYMTREIWQRHFGSFTSRTYTSDFNIILR
jgi:hypothetical protein